MTIRPIPNSIVFCERPWKAPALVLAALVVLTMGWAIHVFESLGEDSGFDDLERFSIASRLFHDVALTAPLDARSLYDLVPAAVVGIGGSRVNSDVIASGAIVGSHGYVLTVLHAVADLPEIGVHVRTPNGIRRYEAQIVKTVPSHDLVLLKMMTPDRFLYLTLGDSRSFQIGEPVFGFGHGLRGATIFKQGVLVAKNVALNSETSQMTNLLATDAVYTWEQNGGPLVNIAGEMVGMNVALTNPSGTVEGYAVPTQVIMAHFQDILKFKIGTPPTKKAPPTTGASGAAAPAKALPVAAQRTPAPPVDRPRRGGAAAWWAKARALVGKESGRSLGVNVALGPRPAPPLGAAGGRPGAAANALDNEHLPGLRIGGYPIRTIVGLGLLGLVAGMIGGMMTMGGGVLQVAGMMVFFGYGMYLIRPVTYLTNIFVYGAAAIRNNRSGMVMWDKVRPLAPWAVAGVVGGYFIGNVIGERAIVVLLGTFALLAGAKALHEIFADGSEGILRRVATDPPGNEPEKADILRDLLGPRGGDSWWASANGIMKTVSLGLPMGLFSGILGISGGVVEVPLQRYFGGVTLRNAIANSSVLVFWASLSGTVVAFGHGISTGLIDWYMPVTLASIMVPGAYVGGILGAKLMKVLPALALKWFYAAVMLTIAAKMLLAP